MVKVKPIPVVRQSLQDVAIGSKFTLNGREYIKIDENNDDFLGMSLTTVTKPVVMIGAYDKTNEKSLHERAVEKTKYYLDKETEKHPEYEQAEVVFMFNREYFKTYGSVVYPHVKDEWYIEYDNDETHGEGNYLYADEFCTLHESNIAECKEKDTPHMLGVRTIFAFMDDIEVLVHFSEKV